MFVLTLLIVLWVPRFIKAIPAPLIAIVLLTVFTVTSGQLLPTVGDEGSMSGGLPGLTQLLVPLNLHTLAIIWPCALSIAFVGLMESLLTARLVDDLTVTPSNKNRESTGLGIANILAGFYGGIAGCAMIGQTIVNVEMGKGRSRVSTFAAGLVLLLLVTALSEVMAKIPMSVLAGIMVIVAVKTFSWHSIQPATLTKLPVTETLVMLVTVAATVSTGNPAIGVVVGVMTMLILPRIVRRKRATTSETALPDREKNKETTSISDSGYHDARADRRVAPELHHRHRNDNPINAAISRLSIIARVITPPSAISSYSHRVMPPIIPPHTRPLISATPISRRMRNVRFPG